MNKRGRAGQRGRRYHYDRFLHNHKHHIIIITNVRIIIIVIIIMIIIIKGGRADQHGRRPSWTSTISVQFGKVSTS